MTTFSYILWYGSSKESCAPSERGYGASAILPTLQDLILFLEKQARCIETKQSGAPPSPSAPSAQTSPKISFPHRFRSTQPTSLCSPLPSSSYSLSVHSARPTSISPAQSSHSSHKHRTRHSPAHLTGFNNRFSNHCCRTAAVRVTN